YGSNHSGVRCPYHGRPYVRFSSPAAFRNPDAGAFAAFALILAMVGIYGVISYLVTQSAHDIGLRIALGASARDIVGLVVRQGMELAGIGMVLGVIGAAASTRVMSSLLFGVSARDALTFTSASLILVLVAFLASFFPARRATRIDPMAALREE